MNLNGHRSQLVLQLVKISSSIGILHYAKQYLRISTVMIIYKSLVPGEIHNILSVWVCATQMDGFFGPNFLNKGHFFGRFP